jgi:hypothetical protein
MKNRALLGMAACLLVLGGSGPARADVLFSNFGAGQTYQTGVGWTLSTQASSVGQNFAQGDAFTPSETANVTSVSAAIGLVTGANFIELRLFTDAGGKPGTLLESYDFTGAMGNFGNANPPLTAASTVHPLLTAGQQYWLIAFPSQNTWAAWNFNNTGDTGPHALTSDNGTTYQVGTNTRGAFEVDGAFAIPEPTSLALAGIGFCGLLGYRWRRSRSRA